MNDQFSMSASFAGSYTDGAWSTSGTGSGSGSGSYESSYSGTGTYTDGAISGSLSHSGEDTYSYSSTVSYNYTDGGGWVATGSQDGSGTSNSQYSFSGDGNYLRAYTGGSVSGTESESGSFQYGET